MKTSAVLAIVFAIGFSGCTSSKPLPKLCTVTIEDPAKVKKEKTNTHKECRKRKHLWSQFGIEK